MFLLFVAGAVGAAAQSDYLNVVRQIQQDSGVEWDVTVPPEGSAASQVAMEEGGALFQLWTLRLSTNETFLLDQKLVGSYIPKAEIVIRTGDPYTGVPRTLVGQPFEVELTVEGLLSGPDLPAAAKQVLIQHEGMAYPGQTYKLPPGEENTEWPIFYQGFYAQNGKVVFEIPSSSLMSEDSTPLAGEERFRVHALPDHDVDQTQIAGATLQVWPKAKATIQNIEPDGAYGVAPPATTIKLERLYPDSVTWVQVYPGGPENGIQGTVIEETVVPLLPEAGYHEPQDREVKIQDWARYLTKGGQWTLEVLTKTPFGVESLGRVPFSIQRGLRVNSLLTTSEESPE